MFQKARIVRLAIALTIAGAIATQIPPDAGTAIARDGYGGRSGSGNREAIQIAVAGLVAYGIYATATAPAGAAAGAAAAGAAGGAGAGAGAVPPVVAANAATKPIWDTLNESDDMKQFANAADQAGLKDELNSPGPYTAFIPNNAAFAAFDSGKLADLQKPENKAQLAALLNNHVIAGKYTIDQLKMEAGAAGPAGKQYKTLAGGTVTITYNNSVLQIDGVTIVETDIAASNGVIHPIGQILPAPGAAAGGAGAGAAGAGAATQSTAQQVPSPQETPAAQGTPSPAATATPEATPTPAPTPDATPAPEATTPTPDATPTPALPSDPTAQ
jgi:uncharacterized surface protein with fasciclin (FAS1) repeats